eukprot:COSAG02_NODE_4325_length_5498_cov_13.427857_2_plen_113_part_00
MCGSVGSEQNFLIHPSVLPECTVEVMQQLMDSDTRSRLIEKSDSIPADSSVILSCSFNVSMNPAVFCTRREEFLPGPTILDILIDYSAFDITSDPYTAVLSLAHCCVCCCCC